MTDPPKEGFPFGYLVAGETPIDAIDFNLTELSIADYEVLDDRIYVLDHT